MYHYIYQKAWSWAYSFYILQVDVVQFPNRLGGNNIIENKFEGSSNRDTWVQFGYTRFETI